MNVFVRIISQPLFSYSCEQISCVREVFFGFSEDHIVALGSMKKHHIAIQCVQILIAIHKNYALEGLEHHWIGRTQ